MNRSKNIGYHTRLYGNNTIKISGGSFGGSLGIETANRLVSAYYTVTVKSSGTPVFVDRQGREVYLYITVDAGETDAGKAAMAEYYKAQAVLEKAEEALEAEVQQALCGLTNEEILRRLSTPNQGDPA